MKLGRTLLVLGALIALVAISDAIAPNNEFFESEGIEFSAVRGLVGPSPGAPPVPMNGTGALLLIPDSTADRVMAFDPATGNVIDPDFIPADPDHLSTPICAILSADGQMVLVSDQIDDVVQAYDLEGNYIGIFAPAGGPDTSILDNIRGIALRPNGNLVVTIGSGTNDDAVAEFDTAGNYLGNFVANGAGGLNSPFDAYFRESDVLVGGITSDAIHRYDLDGNPLADLTPINSFPEQIAEAANGNVLVANFSGSEEGIVEYLPDGTLVGIYDPSEIGGYRGVYELPNGNFLTTNGSGVYEMDRNGNLIDTKFTGVSGRFIEYVVIGQEATMGYLDIKPGSCPNPFNTKSRGVLPVAILGTAEFDVTQVDLGSLVISRADGVGGSVAPIQGPPGPNFSYEDTGTPYDGDPCGCQEMGGDGIMDLNMKFDNSTLTQVLELGGVGPGMDVQLVVSGMLLDGTPFTATDCIVMVPVDGL